MNDGLAQLVRGGEGIKLVAAHRLASRRNYQLSRVGRAIDQKHCRRRHAWPGVLLYCMHYKRTIILSLGHSNNVIPQALDQYLVRPRLISIKIIIHKEGKVSRHNIETESTAEEACGIGDPRYICTPTPLALWRVARPWPALCRVVSGNTRGAFLRASGQQQGPLRHPAHWPLPPGRVCM